MNKKTIDNIVWWIPFRKLRDSVRIILELLYKFEECNCDIKTKLDNVSSQNNLIYELNTKQKEVGTVLCPCCGWNGLSFLHFNGRDNAQCPNCGSRERHRYYYLYLLRNIPVDINIQVLHFAPEGPLQHVFSFFNNVKYISCDIKEGRAMRVEDITKISFDDNSFDIVFASHVLEHIEDDTKAMKEVFRILKPSGFAILQVPLFEEHKGIKLKKTYEDFSITSEEDRERVFGQYDHVRKYEKNDYIERLKKAGFNVIEDNFISRLHLSVIEKYALLERLDINTSQKYGVQSPPIFLCIK